MPIPSAVEIAELADTAEAADVDSSNAGQVGWIVSARVTSQLAQFLTILVGARFLAPAEFGTFALLSALSIGLTRLAEAGWREFVMLAKKEEDLSQTHALAAVSAGACFLIGVVISLIFNVQGASQPQVWSMLLLSVWIVLTTLTSVQSGLLVRSRRLKALSQAQILSEVVGFVVTVSLIASGSGILGLVLGKLLTQTVIFLTCIGLTRWFELRWPGETFRGPAVSFSSKILATRLISFAHDNLPLFLIGLVVGPASAGIFRAAGRLAGGISEIVNEPIRLLVWSNIHSTEARDVVDRILIVTIILAAPLFVGLALVSKSVVLLFLGPDWLAAAPLLALFAVANLFSVINVATEPLLASAKKVSLLPWISLLMTLSMLLVILALASWGIHWIVVGQLAVAVLLFPGIVWIQHAYGGTSPSRIARGAYPAVIGIGAMIGAVELGEYYLPTLALAPQLALKIAGGALAYVTTLLVLIPSEEIRRIKGLVWAR
ncbi:hypothetical protein ASG43_21870 [Aureimonas sp. Leaf454]|uniref:oligosaccharide flippase family protein n=1 Tax=Aureimonas sp. Leaf454 TaxID=1736381 RepID=UPI0006FE9864|nr:oligosaccharide flippase family protein [Aureimonas sp. Leaf454]KQT50175.1 hypothetical protein ASG43_21870 [Aureimonas sp. Leaf454]